MNRVVAGTLGLLAGAALMVGCSNDKGGPEATAAAGETQAPDCTAATSGRSRAPTSTTFGRCSKGSHDR